MCIASSVNQLLASYVDERIDMQQYLLYKLLHRDAWPLNVSASELQQHLNQGMVLRAIQDISYEQY